ncbi:MAG: HIT domain-containing protein [Acidimicrobiia bacterium]|nr:HIT domain-containing protein [Acidimicrobiia bacterium]
MDRIWSPWRYQYVSKSSPSNACIFCEKAAQDCDRENLILLRGNFNFILLNIFPYTNGHIMIAPYQHVATLEQTPEPALIEMMQLARRAEAKLRAVYRAPGINLGMNIGECAGAGVAGHIHLHLLPRWPADSNFMTTVAETRVLPEDLSTTWEKLSSSF